MTTPAIPDPKAPPKRMQDAARTERNRRKACHGTWTPCTPKCSA